MWDAGQDVDALLDEYDQRFYGPAAEPMKAFIEYCEIHYSTFSLTGEDSFHVTRRFGQLFER